jgi:hypothetical protein
MIISTLGFLLLTFFTALLLFGNSAHAYFSTTQVLVSSSSNKNGKYFSLQPSGIIHSCQANFNGTGKKIPFPE